MNQAPKRIRAWAPKSRAGCVGCKHRRVRCDQGSPRCKSCTKRNIDCVYQIPKTWLFEARATHLDVSPPSGAIAPLYPPVITPWGSPEETRALQFFLERAALWLSGFSPFQGPALWTVDMPRIAASAPAIKNLLTAFTLLEMPIRDASPLNVRAHSQTILRHYTHGLHQLRKPHLSAAESFLGPLLAWAIELHNLDHTRAQMHIHGAKALHARVLQSSRNLQHDDFVNEKKLHDLHTYMGMWHWVRARILPPTFFTPPTTHTTPTPNSSLTPSPTHIRSPTQPQSTSGSAPSSRSTSPASSTTTATHTPPASPPIDLGITTVLTLLNNHITPTDSPAVRAAFVHYFAHVHSPAMTPAQLAAARLYLLDWELRIYQNKYLTREASIVFNALHLLCNLAAVLLPVDCVVGGPVEVEGDVEAEMEGEVEKDREGDGGEGRGSVGRPAEKASDEKPETRPENEEEEQPPPQPPPRTPTTHPAPTDDKAMELALHHILRRCEWMLGLRVGKDREGVERGSERDADELQRTVGLVLRAMRWLAPVGKARAEAGRLLCGMGVDLGWGRGLRRG